MQIKTASSGDFRDECGVVGGSPEQSIDECINSLYHGCDAFLEEECQYAGADLGLSPPDGQVNTALECEELCVLYQVEMIEMICLECLLQDVGCEYWVFNASSLSCSILDSSSRQCQGMTGNN